MRILFDSRLLQHKDPFGTLVPGEECALCVHVPLSVGAVAVRCRLRLEDTGAERDVLLEKREIQGQYQLFRGRFSLDTRGLYFYYFLVDKPQGSFRLFRQGSDTNMEAGDLWQLSCVPREHTTPPWAQGAVIYQIFPDRFRKAGECDLKGKLEPYTLHASWNEEVVWKPEPDGRVLNNDFYGGNFRGIREKLPYLKEMGADILYLNPISKSFSSHRYDTGDYKTPDPMLGTTEDFRELCRQAHGLGLRVILDGVFSHTGSDSLYFNREGHFPGVGAWQSQDSPYYSWYEFHRHPDSYKCWWNFETLPTVNKLDPAFMEYIITGEDSVVAHWLGLGADGFRLDVVDELPDAFTDALKRRIRQLKPDALLIGEVWEDASNKMAYGQRRRYFVDGILDSVMNYPFRTAILNFLRERDDGRGLKETVMSIAENYPPQVLQCNMNLLGTHDTPRALTALVDDFDGSREEKARRRLSRSQMALAMERLQMASFLQYALPGAPSLYYGDEAGMEGYKDPFNRRPYPWGREEPALVEHFKRLGQLRREIPCLRRGGIAFFQAGDQRLGFCRELEGSRVRVYLNRSCDDWQIPGGQVLYGRNLRTVAAQTLTVAPMGFCMTREDG